MSTVRPVTSRPQRVRLGSIWFLFFLSLMLTSLSLRAQERHDGKTIVVAPVQSGSDLNVIFEPFKTNYRVQEPIRLRVKGNKTFFLYVYSIDDQSGEAVLLLPNRQQSGNKYPPGRFFTVPGNAVEFYADRSGYERIVMIASTRYIDVERARYKNLGDFSATKSLDLENTFQSKGIYIRRTNRQRNRKEVVVKEANLTISGESRRIGDRLPPPAPRQEGGYNAITFVSTARDRYYEGENFPVIFGSDQPGWVNVFVVEPDGRYSLLTREQVDGNRIYKVTAQSNPPYGTHQLVAIYSNNGVVDDTLLRSVSGRQEKGLSLVSEARRPYAIRYFHIEPRR
ncbi:MAG: DUF4384 domain-containing protein [Methylococcales bacterium]